MAISPRNTKLRNLELISWLPPNSSFDSTLDSIQMMQPCSTNQSTKRPRAESEVCWAEVMDSIDRQFGPVIVERHSVLSDKWLEARIVYLTLDKSVSMYTKPWPASLPCTLMSRLGCVCDTQPISLNRLPNHRNTNLRCIFHGSLNLWNPFF